MKVLHTAIMSEPMIGPLRQMEMEQQSADKLGLNWKASFFLSQSIESPVLTKSPVSSVNRMKFRFSYYRWLFKTSKEYDVILLRYSTYDPLQLFFILACRRPVYSVHHALEVPELHAVKSDITGSKVAISLKIAAEKILGALSLSFVDGVIGNMQESIDYNLGRRFIKRSVPSIVYSNGVEFYSSTLIDDGSAALSRSEKQSSPVFLFVSSVYGPWQGLEELVSAAASHKAQFICHVVGDLTPVQTELLKVDSRFVVHGRLDVNTIAKLIAESDIGLSILAAYKKKMKNNPALKVREYLKEGLAVYAGHGDVMPDDYQYYKQGPIDIDGIVNFAIQNRENDRKAISDSARPYIEKEVILARVHAFLMKNNKI